MALDANDLKQIGELAAKAVAKGTKKLGEDLAAVAGTVKGLTEGDTSIDARLKKAGEEFDAKLAAKGAKEGDDQSDDKNKGKGGDEEPGWFSKYREESEKRTAALEARNKKADEDHAGRQALESARDRARQWIAAKYKNLPKAAQEVMAGRIAPKLPKDDAAVEAAFNEIKAELAAFGIKPESLTADPKAEGARDAGGGGGAEDEAERVKRIMDGAGKSSIAPGGALPDAVRSAAPLQGKK